MKDTKSILLLLVSICLIGSWIFHVYDKSKYAVVKTPSIQERTVSVNQMAIDSLEQRYRREKQAFEQMRSGNDSLSQELETKRSQLDSLRSQIDRMKVLLFRSTSSKNDHPPSGSGMSPSNGATQVRRNQQMASSSSIPFVEATIPQNQHSASSRPHSQIVPTSSGLNATDFQVTNSYRSAPLQLSFQIYQSAYSIDDAQLYVVVKDPSGSVLQDDQWSAGVFTSQKEGTLKYSRRIRTNYVRGERKRLQVEVPASSIHKGKYEVLVYHNGVPIGASSLALP